MVPVSNLWKILFIFLVNLIATGFIVYIGIEFISDDGSISYGKYIFEVCSILILQMVFNTLMFYHVRYETDQTLTDIIRESGLYGFISVLIANIILAALTFL